jgi:hypothetical protein
MRNEKYGCVGLQSGGGVSVLDILLNAGDVQAQLGTINTGPLMVCYSSFGWSEVVN